MLGELARTSGIATPTTDQLRQFDRTRPGKRVSNADWVSPVDPEARITRLKDGRTHPRLQARARGRSGQRRDPRDRGPARRCRRHPDARSDARGRRDKLEALALAPGPGHEVEVVADKGYHARYVLKRLATSPWTTRIAEPARRTVLRWHGDDDARRAVYANRARLLSGVARVALILRAVLCERTFAHVLDRGGMRRTWLRGRDNVAKRYLIHVAGHNLGLLMRALLGAGTPRAAADLRLLWLTAGDHLVLVLIVSPEPQTSTGPAMIATITVTPDDGALSTGC
jgi:hypothetical protein